ncbi:uncharacterized protein LOC129949190 [Eupeodes corollae]|uniref:uncharacterized protein LOC129949190 n=1 Tax=Eupeodes corollae TaxID=290404 RepID=UPI0024902D4D|nr:uncharacterized protein LOC129949190 [Eupeodes corollae]
MNNCNPVSSPMDVNVKLSKENCPKSEKEKLEMSNVPYQELIGSLLFAAQISRPDICFAVNFLSKFINNNPGRLHWLAAKRILRYLKGTLNLKLSYNRNGNSEVVGFCDADYANDLDERKSVSGYVFLAQGGAISWGSRKQATVALSTAEAEYISMGVAVQEAMWLKGIQKELTGVESSMKIFCDSQCAIHLASNECYRPRTKHIDIRHHFVRDIVAEKQIQLKSVRSDEMAADILTKPLSSPIIKKFIVLIGLLMK